MKTVGIACDNYKQDKFEEELKKNGFTQYTISPLTMYTEIIKVKIDEKDLSRFALLVKTINDSFKS